MFNMNSIVNKVILKEIQNMLQYLQQAFNFAIYCHVLIF